MGAKIQAFDIFQTCLSSHYPLPLSTIKRFFRNNQRHYISEWNSLFPLFVKGKLFYNKLLCIILSKWFLSYHYCKVLERLVYSCCDWSKFRDNLFVFLLLLKLWSKFVPFQVFDINIFGFNASISVSFPYL
jgi:hypothetical protein